MSTTPAPFSNCDAIVIDSNTGLPRACKSNASKVRISVLVKGGEAVSEDSVKSNNMPGWFRLEYCFCGTHTNTLNKGKVVKVRGKQASQAQLFPTKTITKQKRAVPQAFCGVCKIKHDLAQVKVCYKQKYAS